MAKFPSFFSKKRSPNQCKTDRSSEICTENRHEIRHFLPIVLQRNLPRKIPRFSREIGPLLTRIWLWKSREIWLFPMIYQKPVVYGVFFSGVGGRGVGKYFFLLQTLTDHSAQCMQKACIGPTRFALKNSTQWTTECPNHFYDAIRLLKIGINSLFLCGNLRPFWL